MELTFSTILIFIILPVGAMIGGSVVAAIRPPGAVLRSILQHFAAGVVFSVVAVELLPDVMKVSNAIATSVGFALGVAVMVGLKMFSAGDKARAEVSGKLIKAEGKVSATLLFAIGIDIVVDGFMLGIGYAVGAKEGRLLAVALSIELVSLGLALASGMTDAGVARRKIILISAALSPLIVVGAAVGAIVLTQVSPGILDAVLSFGLAALMFLVTEELLVEAHEVPETPLITSVFFAGFLIFLVLGMVG